MLFMYFNVTFDSVSAKYGHFFMVKHVTTLNQIHKPMDPNQVGTHCIQAPTEVVVTKVIKWEAMVR